MCWRGLSTPITHRLVISDLRQRMDCIRLDLFPFLTHCLHPSAPWYPSSRGTDEFWCFIDGYRKVCVTTDPPDVRRDYGRRSESQWLDASTKPSPERSDRCQGQVQGHLSSRDQTLVLRDTYLFVYLIPHVPFCFSFQTPHFLMYINCMTLLWGLSREGTEWFS